MRQSSEGFSERVSVTLQGRLEAEQTGETPIVVAFRGGGGGGGGSIATRRLSSPSVSRAPL